MTSESAAQNREHKTTQFEFREARVMQFVGSLVLGLDATRGA